jgi:tryptophan-rich sensory protein
MGYASHLAIRALDAAITTVDKENAELAMTLYYGQLLMNFTWTPIFFLAKKVGSLSACLRLVDLVLSSAWLSLRTRHHPDRPYNIHDGRCFLG